MYAKRRFLRTLEKGWAWIESRLNRLTDARVNPLAHLDTLSIFLLIVLIVSGIYLVLIYRPGADRAYQTTQAISATFFGSLMRSMHRYAADALLIVILLHALRMLLGDRFWGTRWLAWTSGWFLLGMTWLVGVMGYWLVWDEGAQWINEYLMRLSGGSFALTFTAPDPVSKTFAIFVIVLFLHVFLPLLAFAGIAIHVWRLNRSRWWAPRVLMIQAVLGLTLLALLFPVQSGAMANFSRLIADVKIDSLYLGFLVLIERWGNTVFWSVVLLVGLGLFFLPWLIRSRHAGPAEVIEDRCTGCTLCAIECPYLAIQMIQRRDGSPHPRLAVVNPQRCTGCGICVGACPVEAIDLKNLSARAIFAQLKEEIATANRTERPVTVVLTCQRDRLFGDSSKLAPQSSEAVQVQPWNDGFGKVILATFPCIGMADTDWVPELLANGAQDVIFNLCAPGECIYREGNQWILSRFKRHSALLQPGLHLVESGVGKEVALLSLIDLIDSLQKKEHPREAPFLPDQKKKLLWHNLLSGFLVLLVLFALALPATIHAGYRTAAEAGIRLEVDAKGKISKDTAITAPGVQLPPGVDPEKIFGGRHFPMHLRLVVDGNLLEEHTIEPAGLRKDGRLNWQGLFFLSPGEHRIEILINNDGTDFRQAFGETLSLEQGKVLLLSFDEGTERFGMRR